MAKLIEALRSTAAKWRAGNQEHREGVVLVWDGEVYGWKDELRDPASERPGGDDYNGAKAWVAVDPDQE
ncbi:antirestriction protein ArdR [Pseudomonas sp. CFBP 8772]|uniref:antirestriction protein ArdR n=1 Tax=Pseudomonas sp. CFBP 8772 TaxID=2775284 RepID=UPI00177BAFB5|nr:antirestriction protein ArdR [Pseudomonas sp. CFBP 8772]MBD8599001.1 antirestriction protein ArdR [Pseudomonas sp. CFBP 8772]